MMDMDNDDPVDLGPLPPSVTLLLQQGIAAHFSDPDRAETCFRAALELDPGALAAYRCLTKHCNRRRQFDAAEATTRAWIGAAAGQAGLPATWQAWRPDPVRLADPAFRAALMALKAYAFIQLRKGNTGEASAALEHLQGLDPEDGIGASVIAALIPAKEAA